MPVAPGVGRYFVPLNRGKRSIIADLKTDEGLATSALLLASADVALHNFPPQRAARFGLEWEGLHAAHPRLVVGRVTSYGTSGTARRGTGVRPRRPGSSRAADGARISRGHRPRAGGRHFRWRTLTAGFLLATGVLAALVHARETGAGELVDVSLLAAALAVQLQDLVWLEGEADADGWPSPIARISTRRANEIAGGVAMNPYYRCFEASDGFLAVACLNIAQRRAFLGHFGLDDPTIDAPDLVPTIRPFAPRRRSSPRPSLRPSANARSPTGSSGSSRPACRRAACSSARRFTRIRRSPPSR
jgi:crotonobetainyl-CoA:carnitine CoA-transferase CaiB-like acyl-CoA transferase